MLPEGIKSKICNLYIERCTIRYRLLAMEELYNTKMKHCNPKLVSFPNFREKVRSTGWKCTEIVKRN